MTAGFIPHDLAAERACLGAVLLECDRVLPELEKIGLRPNDFYLAQNRKIFSAMLELRAAGRPVDVLTVERETGLTITELSALMDACPTWAHATHYAEQILEASRKRQIIEHAASLTEAAGNGQPVSEILADAIAELQALQRPDENETLFESWRLSEIQNYIPDPNNFLAGDGWLRRGAGCLLTGGTGIGKSVLAQQITLAVVSGVNVMGCVHVAQPYRALYVQAENDQDTIQRDVSAIISKSEPKLCPMLIEASFRIAHVYGLGGIEFADWLRRQFDKSKPDLLVIDPYQAFLGGEADINSTACFLSWIRPINRLIQDAGCALLLVTHTPKPREREGWTARESVYMAAGSSAISNWARTSAELTQAGEEDGRYRLRFGKNAERTGVIDEDGRSVRDLFIEHSGSVQEPFWRVSDNQGAPSASGYASKITKVANDHPSMSYREIAKEVGCSVGTVSIHYPRKEV
ncbi:MAG: AAA family ATPase [Verrucomicrobia bacterium]|nr:AAA family ATPase [Verrucomicrobiota bacterium]MBU4428974.1 AAA family ATPase [Verrucomicrobiota bacterium]MCG2680917.1 AAA family ATPase [Kiritimatiellia bacterium]